jgi:hypothetical protein
MYTTKCISLGACTHETHLWVCEATKLFDALQDWDQNPDRVWGKGSITELGILFFRI